MCKYFVRKYSTLANLWLNKGKGTAQDAVFLRQLGYKTVVTFSDVLVNELCLNVSMALVFVNSDFSGKKRQLDYYTPYTCTG